MKAALLEGDNATLHPQDLNSLITTTIDSDSYNEDETELQFLKSKPTCFLVLGKPGCGKTAIARKLSQNWNCELVSPTEIILQNMELETEMGQKAKSMLLRGEAVPEEVVAKMLEDKINSPEVAHNGYVLDGLPSMCEDYMHIKDQLELIKNFSMKPDFIVYIRIPDQDLETRRIGQRIDPVSGELYTIEVYNPEKLEQKIKPSEAEEQEEEQEEEEEVEEEEENVHLLSPEIVARLLVRPEDMPEHVVKNVAKYRSNLLKILEDYMADHNQQYLLELDGNQPVAVLEKQILSKLNCFVIRPAAVPVRLATGDPEEEEINDEVDTDELMRTLAPKNMVAPRFRWRRSRWLRYCPVALQEGNIVLGKAEFACGFLDKIYLMSSPENFAKFLKNPRPYLLPPQPRPPAKFAVLGPPTSGCSTLSKLLSQRYGAQVVDINSKLAPRIAEERAKFIEQIKVEATENAIEQIKKKLKDAQDAAVEAARIEAERIAAEEAERLAKEAAEREAAATAVAAEEGSQEADNGELKDPADSQLEKTAVNDPVEPTEQKGDEGEGSVVKRTAEETPKPLSPTPLPEIEVDSTHPEVQEIVQAAIRQAELQPITLPSEVTVDLLEAAIKEIEESNAAKKPDGPLHGGWILDNFPQTREQWALLVERNLLPDDVITLRDSSDGGQFLLKRWYGLNKANVDNQIKERLEREAAIIRQREEEQRQRAERELQLAEEAEKARKAVERAQRVEAGEDPAEVDKDIYGIVAAPEQSSDIAEHADIPVGTPIVIDEAVTSPAPPEVVVAEAVLPELSVLEPETETLAEGTRQETPPKLPSAQVEMIGEQEEQDGLQQGSDTHTFNISASAETGLPSEGPELEAARERRKEWDREFPSVEAVITSTGTIDPIVIELEDTDVDAIIKQAVGRIEKRFEHQGWEYTGMDLDEEEEDAAAEPEQGEEEAEDEEEEEEDPNKSKKKPLGDLNHFCPVALLEKNVLWPGNPECSAKYREKVYYLSTEEARTRFLEAPEKYLPKKCSPMPPAVRLLALGAKGSGKSLHSRQLAKRHNLFHIQFEERLQEMIMKKTKKLIGPLYEAQEEFKDSPEDMEEDQELAEFERIFTMDDLDEKPLGEGDESKDPISASLSEETEKDEAEEEAEPEFTEEEEAIKAYLEGGMEDPMSPEILSKIIGALWETEPFRSTGFILEGFPRTADEVRWLAESGYFPDTAIIIASEDSDIIGRLLPPKMELWKAKRERKIKRRQRQKERAKKIRLKEMEKRRRELIKERDQKLEERRAEKEAAKAEASDEELEEEEVEEEEEGDDIEAMLAEEFEAEDEEEEDEEETEEDARDRLSNDLAELYDNDTNRLTAVTEALEDCLIPHVEVEGGRKPHIIRYQLSKALKPYVECRESVFERVYAINEKLAEKMIAVGYKQPSRFGRWCPVQLMEGECIQPMQGTGYHTYPVVYRSHIYFLSSTQNRDLFIQNPVRYLKQNSPKSVIPIRMAIIGPPKSGKTSLARRFELECGAVRISIGDALRLVVTMQPKTHLARNINAQLRKGETVSDDLAIKALQVALLDMRCSTRGYILDGFPVNKKQIELMTAAGVIPVKVLELSCSNMEIMVRATKDRLEPERSYPKHDSAQVVTVKINTYYKHIEEIRSWYKMQHMNYEIVKVEHSKWWVWNEALQIAKKGVQTIQMYLENIGAGKAACVANLCITPSEFKSRLGDFAQYCPVQLAAGELVDCGTNESLEFAVEFRGHYYKCCGQRELDQFLAKPELYVPPLAPRRLPPKELLPKRITAQQAKAMFPKQVELMGYCPVTYLNGKLRYEAIIPGDIDIGCVLYRDKLYIFQSEENLLKFLRLPEQYWNLKLPHKLPPKKEPLVVTSLPMLGYMEQTVAQAITKALTRCGCFKPKYPFLTATQSALIYIAYHIKAFNPKNSEYIRQKYKKKLEQFEETCNLIRYLGDNMTVRYKEPEARPIDFNHKLKTFLDLKNSVQTSS